MVTPDSHALIEKILMSLDQLVCLMIRLPLLPLKTKRHASM